MRTIILAGCIFILTNLNAQSSAIQLDSLILVRKAALINQSFPSFTAKTDGRTVTNDIFKNKVVLINFWFEGCLGCMQEMKSLNDLFDRLKGDERFVFTSFTFDDTAAIKRVVAKFRLKFSVLQTSQKECKRLMIEQNGYPTTIILDKQGKIRFIHGGYYDIPLQKQPQEVIATNMYDEVKSLLQ